MVPHFNFGWWRGKYLFISLRQLLTNSLQNQFALYTYPTNQRTKYFKIMFKLNVDFYAFISIVRDHYGQVFTIPFTLIMSVVRYNLSEKGKLHYRHQREINAKVIQQRGRRSSITMLHRLHGGWFLSKRNVYRSLIPFLINIRDILLDI